MCRARIACVSTLHIYLAVQDWNPGLPFTGAAFLGHAKFLVFAVLFALTGFAITIIARSTLVGVLAVVALAAVTLTQAVAAAAPALDALFPVSAARNLPLDADDLTAGPGHALLVLTGWACLSVGLAWAPFIRRDS